MSGSFSWVDWTVVGALLLLTTWVGHRAAGRPSTLKEFFLGGRRLPWFAVAASIVATSSIRPRDRSNREKILN